jgi:hypothetical protein
MIQDIYHDAVGLIAFAKNDSNTRSVVTELTNPLHNAKPDFSVGLNLVTLYPCFRLVALEVVDGPTIPWQPDCEEGFRPIPNRLLPEQDHSRDNAGRWLHIARYFNRGTSMNISITGGRADLHVELEGTDGQIGARGDYYEVLVIGTHDRIDSDRGLFRRGRRFQLLQRDVGTGEDLSRQSRAQVRALINKRESHGV